MGFGGNFDPVVIDAAGMHVTGTSEALDGGRLVSRHIAIRQPVVVSKGDVTHFADGPATGVLDWNADPVLSAEGFEIGQQALAIGTETHLVGDAERPEVTPAFVTLTWAEVVEVQRK